VVSREQNDQYRTVADAQEESVRAAQAAIESAKANIAADRATVERAKLDMNYTTIRSPIAGRTGNLLVKAGNLVKANGDAPLVTIHQIAPVYVSFGVPEQELARIREAMSRRKVEVRAHIPGADLQPSSGLLSFVDNAVDPATGTIRLKATFPNREGRLWPGQFVNVTLTLGMEENQTVVPAEAIQNGQNGPYAYVVSQNNTVENRLVKVHRSIEGQTIVTDGVRPGEKVVTDGHLRLAPGAQVRVVQDAKQTAAAGAGI
jgi:multidrug efflux system membrane fusion protein